MCGFGGGFCEKMKKNLHMSQILRNFVRFLARNALKRGLWTKDKGQNNKNHYKNTNLWQTMKN